MLVGVCYTVVDVAVGGLPMGWWAVDILAVAPQESVNIYSTRRASTFAVNAL